MDWPSVWLSVRLAAVTTAALLVLGTALACWLASTRRRWAVLVEAVVALPLVLPPTVLGFYLLVALGPRSPVGNAYESVTGARLVFSFGGLALASVVYSLPFMVQPVTAALRGVDRRMIEASWTLGVGRFGTFFRLVLPVCAPGVLSGAVLTFAHTLGEFGVVMMIGGNIGGATRTASISIFDDVQALNYRRAAATSAVLLAVSFLALLATFLLRASAGRPRPGSV